ncbi:MAG: acyl-protein synthetase [Candidatus Omnitrophota bacterium]|nr:MAG: acyl-protein synthetase [Candidatus Omnitrophota bacterium]
MSRIEKIMVMEALWQDLSSEEKQLDSPTWHRDELVTTEQRVAAGDEQFVDWEIAKEQLRRRFK